MSESKHGDKGRYVSDEKKRRESTSSNGDVSRIDIGALETEADEATEGYPPPPYDHVNMHDAP